MDNFIDNLPSLVGMLYQNFISRNVKVYFLKHGFDVQRRLHAFDYFKRFLGFFFNKKKREIFFLLQL